MICIKCLDRPVLRDVTETDWTWDVRKCGDFREIMMWKEEYICTILNK